MDLSKYFCKKPSDVSDEDALRYLLNKAKEDIILEAKNEFINIAAKARNNYFKNINKTHK